MTPISRQASHKPGTQGPRAQPESADFDQDDASRDASACQRRDTHVSSMDSENGAAACQGLLVSLGSHAAPGRLELGRSSSHTSDIHDHGDVADDEQGAAQDACVGGASGCADDARAEYARRLRDLTGLESDDFDDGECDGGFDLVMSSVRACGDECGNDGRRGVGGVDVLCLRDGENGASCHTRGVDDLYAEHGIYEDKGSMAGDSDSDSDSGRGVDHGMRSGAHAQAVRDSTSSVRALVHGHALGSGKSDATSGSRRPLMALGTHTSKPGPGDGKRRHQHQSTLSTSAADGLVACTSGERAHRPMSACSQRGNNYGRLAGSEAGERVGGAHMRRPMSACGYTRDMGSVSAMVSGEDTSENKRPMTPLAQYRSTKGDYRLEIEKLKAKFGITSGSTTAVKPCSGAQVADFVMNVDEGDAGVAVERSSDERWPRCGVLEADVEFAHE
jgi:hypothetical protein